MEQTIIISDIPVTIYRLNHDCDTYGSESNVNFTVHDESNDNVKYLFASYDSNAEADAVYNYIINNPDEFYLEKYCNYGLDGKYYECWFDSLNAKDYQGMMSKIRS